MPNIAEIKERIKTDRESLARIDTEREVLLQMIRANERWLALQMNDQSTMTLPLNGDAAAAEKSGPPLMLAIMHILYSSQVPLHTKAIWERAQEMNAVTKADSPLAAVDVTLYNLSKKKLVEKVSPRTYRWVGALPPPPLPAMT